jgi:hypothetical protein
VSFFEYLSFPPVVIFPPLLRTYLHLHDAINRRANGRRLGSLKNQRSFENGQALDTKEFSIYFISKGFKGNFELDPRSVNSTPAGNKLP